MDDEDVTIRATPTSVLLLITLADMAGKAMSEMIVALLKGHNGLRVGEEARKTGNKVMNG